MIKRTFLNIGSIKNKIIAIILLVTFFILTLGFALNGVWEVKRIKSVIQTDLVLKAKLIADYCIVPLSFGDDKQATEALSRLKLIEFIEEGYLYDKEGKLFAAYPDTIGRNFLDENTESLKHTFEKGYFYIYEPIVFEGEKYGKLIIIGNSKPLDALKRKVAYTFSISLVVMMVFSVLLAGWMQRFISEPIINLKNHIDKISISADYNTKIIKQSNDEIGGLYEGFNNLLKQIRIRQEESFKSDNKFRSIAENTPVGIFITDVDGKTTYWNQKLCDITGMKAEQGYGTGWVDGIHPDDKEQVFEEWYRSTEARTKFRKDYRFIDKAGKVTWAMGQAAPMFDKNGHLIGFAGTITDITDIKIIEKELTSHRNNLEQLVAERTKELEDKNNELENMNDVFVGREYRIKELKEKNKELENNIKNNE